MRSKARVFMLVMNDTRGSLILARSQRKANPVRVGFLDLYTTHFQYLKEFREVRFFGIFGLNSFGTHHKSSSEMIALCFSSDGEEGKKAGDFFDMDFPDIL